MLPHAVSGASGRPGAGRTPAGHGPASGAARPAGTIEAVRRHSSEPSRAPSRPRWRHRALPAVMIALAVVVVGACGGDSSPPAGIADPGATASVPVPDWYTAPFRPPAG